MRELIRANDIPSTYTDAQKECWKFLRSKLQESAFLDEALGAMQQSWELNKIWIKEFPGLGKIITGTEALHAYLSGDAELLDAFVEVLYDTIKELGIDKVKKLYGWGDWVDDLDKFSSRAKNVWKLAQGGPATGNRITWSYTNEHNVGPDCNSTFGGASGVWDGSNMRISATGWVRLGNCCYRCSLQIRADTSIRQHDGDFNWWSGFVTAIPMR